MAEFLLSKRDLLVGLRKLGELAREIGLNIKLVLLGGAVMVLEYQTRGLTHDIDVVILSPERKRVFELVAMVAEEFHWPLNWLNDAAGIFVAGDDIIAHRLFVAPGIEVFAPAIEQMLALKLSAARDEVDLNDAADLLRQMSGSRHEIWQMVLPFVLQGSTATAEDAFDIVWSEVYGYGEDEHNN
jgi:predicted nucleotidyltransferase